MLAQLDLCQTWFSCVAAQINVISDHLFYCIVLARHPQLIISHIATAFSELYIIIGQSPQFVVLPVRNCTICVAKTKALISFVVTAKLICVFVFAYAKSWFSHVAAHIIPVRSPQFVVLPVIVFPSFSVYWCI